MIESSLTTLTVEEVIKPNDRRLEHTLTPAERLNVSVVPLQRLRDMDEDTYEEVVQVWAFMCLKAMGKYIHVHRVGCTGCGDTKDGVAGDAGRADFEQRMNVADSLFNSMQFRDAYDLYLQLLNNPVAEADSEKKLNVLSSISNASELSGHKAEETKWLQQQLDLAKETGNSYYHDFKARYNISPTEYRRR